MTTQVRRERPPGFIHRFDALSVLTLWMFSLYLFPSGASIAAISSLGRPSTILGLACLLWWVLHTILRNRPEARPRQPVRVALVIFALAVLLSYAVANARGIPFAERSVADSAVLRLASWAGPALVAMDGIRDKEEFFILLRRIGVVGAAMATLGLIQFATGRTWIDLMPLPGFTTPQGELDGRGAFFRPVGTASHALEYATVISAALPLTLNAALFLHRSGVLRRWYGSTVITLASILAVSRSAIIGAVVGLLVLIPTWPAKVRARAAVVGIFLMGVVYVTVPGVFGTLRGMFSLDGDSSTDSRVNAWDTAFEFADRYAPVGRGFGTLLATYVILDNAYLGMLIEVGIIGVAAYFGLAITALVVTFRGAKRTGDLVLRNQLQALGAALSAVIVLAAFFDAFAFNQAVATAFLLFGCCGAAHNLSFVRERGDQGVSGLPEYTRASTR